jgi:DNA polymerase elongation subunit (family B)
MRPDTGDPMNFYTNVTRHRNQILVRGISDGKPVKFSVKYKPYLFVQANAQTEHKNLKGEYVGKMQFDSMSETREFLQSYENVAGMNIYGLSDWPYMYIYDNYKGEIRYDPALISVCSIDIETSIEGGFPDIEEADKEITGITIGRNGRKTTFGCGEYKEHQDNVQYYKCADESALLLAFLEVWNGSLYSPDVVTGWNIEFFDIPYLVNRIRRILGSDHAERLSPWKMLREYKVNSRGRECICYAPVGIAVLDYIQLYRKFTYTEQESYRLDYIAQVELGEGKIDFRDEGYTDLDDLRLRNFQRYIEYNIRDVEIVERLEDKLKLIELVYALAYDAKVNYEDTMTTVKQWDVITHNYLLDRNIVVPLNDKNKPDRAFVGGYVKDPKVGMSKWVVSFDLNSLYPHLIMQYNISPETLVTRLKDKVSIDDLLVGGASQFGGYLDKTNCTIAANLCIYTKEKRGFLPSIMDRMYDDRTKYKKQMIECKKEYEKTKDPHLVKEIARLDNMQMAKKIQLNSAYGALGNKWFRWFDVNNAEAITTSGQLSIRWIEKKLNDYLNKLLKTENFDYVLASDTDSVYVTLEYLVKNVFGDDVPETKKVIQYIDKICKERIEPFIDRSYQELAEYMHAYAQKMQMKRENIADKGIWKAKKMYILNVWNSEGVEYEKPKLKMTGIEAVRSSTPTACRDAIKKSLEIIMAGSESDLQKYVANFKSEFSSLGFDDVAFTRGVKDIEKYWVGGRFQSQTPIHVRGSVVYNEMLKKKKLTNKYQSITSGEKIKFAYLKNPNPTQDYVISCPNGLPKELKMEAYIDYAVQFEKGYLSPIESITNTMGWQAEKRATLEDWFS